MELITPSVEIWEQCTSSPVEDMYAHIARCTRVCYQSEKKGNESEEDFVKRVILRHEPWSSDKNHLSVLEHGSVYLKRPIDWADSDYNIFETFYEINPYSKVSYDNSNNCYVSTNLRVLIENNRLYDMTYICSPSDYHFRRVTVSFTTNIGVSREFNRHRVNSIAEESTRYCNYSLGKFNHNVTCVKPAWITENDVNEINNEDSLIRLDALIKEYGTEFEHGWSDIDYYLFALETCNYCYNNLILKGWTPQKAREVLPLATKTQLIHTAFVDDWVHFFNLRADGVSGPVHPNAKLLAAPLKELFIKQGIL